MSASASARATVGDSAGAPGAVRALVMLAAKMSLAQLAPLAAGLYLGGLVARADALAFSSYTLVNSINLTAFLTASSSLQSLYYVAGRAIGRGERDDYERAISTGAVLALRVGIACAAISAAAGGILYVLHLDRHVVSLAAWIGVIAALGIVPSMLMVVYRVHASLNRHAGLVTMLSGVGASAVCVVATIGLRVLRTGPQGATLFVVVTTAASNWLLFFAAIASLRLRPLLRIPGVFARRARLDAATSRLIVSVGWPIGAVVLLDTLASLISQLLVGRFWLEAVPAHAAVILWTAIGLVIPLGIAQSVVQQVAVFHSQGDYAARNRTGYAALAMGALYGFSALALFALAPVAMAGVLLGPSALEPSTQALLRQIMPLGGAVLAFQGVVIVGAAILRGLGETRGPLVQALVGYVVMAGGGQLFFAFGMGLGVVGIWWGLVAGFGSVAVAVTHGVYARFKTGASPASSLHSTHSTNTKPTLEP